MGGVEGKSVFIIKWTLERCMTVRERRRFRDRELWKALKESNDVTHALLSGVLYVEQPKRKVSTLYFGLGALAHWIFCVFLYLAFSTCVSALVSARCWFLFAWLDLNLWMNLCVCLCVCVADSGAGPAAWWCSVSVSPSIHVVWTSAELVEARSQKEGTCVYYLTLDTC